MSDIMKAKQNGNERAERLGIRRRAAGFRHYDLQLRLAHVKELLDLEARHGVPVTQAVDDAIRSYFENRLREMMRGFHGT
jgi:hypothetical protein